MIVTFREENHRYESDPPIKWTSSTKVVEHFCPEFDAQRIAMFCSKKETSKWFGLDTGIIVKIWEEENHRSTRIGSLFHLQQELKAIDAKIKIHRGKELKVYHIPFIDGVKTALHQELNPGCYLEHIIYNEEYKICGQTDIAISDGEYIDILDYKTNKKIDQHAYGYEYGSPNRMSSPISHLEDCNYWHYSLQLSIYMFLARLKNPHLKPGKLQIIHVEFELKGRDQYDFPIVKIVDGYPIPTKVTKYNLPYLEQEVKDCFGWINKYKN